MKDIRTISEALCYTEDWSNKYKNTLYLLKYKMYLKL